MKLSKCKNVVLNVGLQQAEVRKWFFCDILISRKDDLMLISFLAVNLILSWDKWK